MTQHNPNPISPWMSFADPVQASAQYVLQWLSQVYPQCAIQLPAATRKAVPLYDKGLNLHWQDLLDHEPISTHLNMLEWAASQLTQDQRPYLLEACWYLLLSTYAMPSQLPAPLQVLGKALGVDNAHMMTQGEQVWATLSQDGLAGQAALEQQHSDYLTALKLSLIPQGSANSDPWDWRNPNNWRDLARFWPIGVATVVVIALFTATLMPNSTTDDLTATEIEASQTSERATTQAAAATPPAPVETIAAVPESRVASVIPSNHYLVTANLLNLREKPVSGSTIMLILPLDTIVTQLSVTKDGEWAQVSVAEKVGYVSKQYLKPRQ